MKLYKSSAADRNVSYQLRRFLSLGGKAVQHEASTGALKTTEIFVTSLTTQRLY